PGRGERRPELGRDRAGDGADPPHCRLRRDDRPDRAPDEGRAVGVLARRRFAQRCADRRRPTGTGRLGSPRRRSLSRQEVRAARDGGGAMNAIDEVLRTPGEDGRTPGQRGRELLRIEGLQSGYGPVTVLWDIDLSVREGEITALIGSNGAGKSTLMRTISGLVPVRAGRMLWQGADVTGGDPAAVLRLGIAHVPEGRRLFSAMSVEENLLMGAYLRRPGAGDVDRDLERVYSIFPKLKERRRQAAGTLSGGEQQMCA